MIVLLLLSPIPFPRMNSSKVIIRIVLIPLPHVMNRPFNRKLSRVNHHLPSLVPNLLIHQFLDNFFKVISVALNLFDNIKHHPIHRFSLLRIHVHLIHQHSPFNHRNSHPIVIISIIQLIHLNNKQDDLLVIQEHPIEIIFISKVQLMSKWVMSFR